MINQAQFFGTSLNNVNGKCELTGMARYDKKSKPNSTGIFFTSIHSMCRLCSTASMIRVTYTKAKDYLANDHCMNVLDIRNIGYTSAG